MGSKLVPPSVEEVCEICGRTYHDYAHHLSKHPECDPDEEPCPELVECDSDDDCDVDPLAELAGTIVADALRDTVAEDLAELRFDHGNGNAEIARLKALVTKWIAERDQQTARALAPLLRPGVGHQEVAAALGERGLFDGIETDKSELRYTQSKLPYLEPSVVNVGGEKQSDHKVVGFDPFDLLARKLQHDANFRKKAVVVSDRLKTGELYRTTPDGEDVSDILEGAEARFHPELWRPATEDEKFDLRVPLGFNCDDVEVQRNPARASGAHCVLVATSHPYSCPEPVNPLSQVCNTLGVKRGKHKQCGCLMTALSLPAEERFCEENILLPILSRAEVYKKHGMARVVCGVDQSGKQHDEPNFAADMRALDVGRCVRSNFSSLLTPHSSLLTTHYSLLTTHYSLLTAHCSLLTAYRLPPAHRGDPS